MSYEQARAAAQQEKVRRAHDALDRLLRAAFDRGFSGSASLELDIREGGILRLRRTLTEHDNAAAA